MRLYELAIACTVYASMTGFNKSYKEFREKINDQLNFDDDKHLTALLEWLRKWGCRQFEKKDEEIAKESVRKWAQGWVSRLPNVALDQLSPNEMDLAGQAYVSLQTCDASKRKTVGPTGASKILFAARPKALPPWDEEIQKQYKGEKGGYRGFLVSSQQDVLALKRDAETLGISPQRIPERVGLPDSTLCELVNQYTWIVVTKRFPVPTPEELSEWQRWSEGR